MNPTKCANDEAQTLPGRLLCDTCEHRLWQELHWLADVYDPLFQALTRRMDIEEKAEQVKVSGAKDPMVQGLELNDDAANVRKDIRGIAWAGIGWLAAWHKAVPLDQTVPRQLRHLARELSTLTADQEGLAKIRHWGSRIVAARIAAEKLLTPTTLRTRYFYQIEMLSCSADVGDGPEPVSCGGRLGVWMVGGTMVGSDLTCTLNPGHTTSREQAVKDQIKRNAKARHLVTMFKSIYPGRI